MKILLLIFCCIAATQLMAQPKPNAKPKPKPMPQAKPKVQPNENTKAQPQARTVKFRDGSTYKVNGKLVITYNETEKIMYTYYQRIGEMITVTFYKEWMKDKAIDELNVYTFNVALLNPELVNEISEIEDNGFIKGKAYSLVLTANAGSEFEYNQYSAWDSKPTKRSFSIFSIEAVTKEPLTKIVEDIQTVLPKKVD